MIDADLAGRLRALVGLRNRLVHFYEEIDDALVFRSVPESLDDLDAFARAVARLVRCTSRDRGKQRRSSSSPPSARFRHDQRGDLRGGFALHVRDRMAVDIERHCDGGVTKAFGDDLGVNPGAQRQGRMRMP